MNAPAPLPAWADKPLVVVGHATPRASAIAKVTGRATYAADVTRPGMAHAVLLRAAIARGKVTAFDDMAARAYPGVLCVLGPFADWPTLARRNRPVIGPEVRFTGEEIGVVVAETEAIARNAARLVTVTYERAPFCLTIDQALAAGAPNLGTDGNLAGPAETLSRGDLSAAEAAADVVIEQEYSTAAQHHNPLEAHGCVAEWADGGLTLWDSNQGVHMIRERLADTLKMPRDAVRVISRFVGGGFGSKIHLKAYHAIAAIAAREAGRPVRLFMGRREEFIASHQRAPTRRHIRVGATRAGQLCFIDECVTAQVGPTPAFAVTAAGAANGLRLHRAMAVRAEMRRVLTNTQDPIPFRGPSAAEDIFCLEQAIDELAEALSLDPLEFRLRNLAETDPLVGLPYAGKELARCYREGARAFGWQHQPVGSMRQNGKTRGIGMGAAAYDATLYEPSQAEIGCRADGRIELRIGITEIGGGADTVFAQIAAETLGLPLAWVDTRLGDSNLPRSIDATNHSRTSAVVGPAVRAAAEDLRQKLLVAGADLLQADVAAVTLDRRGVSTGDASVSLAAIAVNGEITGRAAREKAPEGIVAAMFAAHFVEVEIDLANGQMQILRAVCAHDAGRILNPLLAQGQVQGGFLQGMGMALQEERVLEPRNGHMLNAAMWAYRTPGILDAPHRTRFVDAGRPDGGNSLGVKGIGEPPLIAAGAAIANAIHNATGIRFRDYPITPAKLLAALTGKAP